MIMKCTHDESWDMLLVSVLVIFGLELIHGNTIYVITIDVIQWLCFDDRNSVFAREKDNIQGTSKYRSPKEPTDASQWEIPYLKA
jgi:hypothetical protein